MMTTQTLEFNVGYAFSKIEKRFFDMCTKGGTSLVGEVHIPQLWMISSDYNGREFLRRLCETFKSFTPDWSINLMIGYEKQYWVINYHIIKKEPPKKMTVEEIEKVLGYKVEIVSE